MSKFDEYIHNILEETYFGGSPYERATRIKRHITFEENEIKKYGLRAPMAVSYTHLTLTTNR